jgi:Alanine dehydrogenase/PNT, N-terminal domain
MKLGIPKEIRADESRVALVPESCRKLAKAGLEVKLGRGAGEKPSLPTMLTEMPARGSSPTSARCSPPHGDGHQAQHEPGLRRHR